MPRISKEPNDQLTKREIDVVLGLSRGLKAEDIAKELYLSPGTVKTHIGNIFRKWQVGTVTETLIKALHMGLLPKEVSNYCMYGKFGCTIDHTIMTELELSVYEDSSD